MFPPVLLFFFFKVTYSKQLQHTFEEKKYLRKEAIAPISYGGGGSLQHDPRFWAVQAVSRRSRASSRKSWLNGPAVVLN